MRLMAQEGRVKEKDGIVYYFPKKLLVWISRNWNLKHDDLQKEQEKRAGRIKNGVSSIPFFPGKQGLSARLSMSLLKEI